MIRWTPRMSDLDTIVSTAWNFHRKAWGERQKAAQ
jgi:UDP-glucose 4-epimerase